MKDANISMKIILSAMFILVYMTGDCQMSRRDSRPNIIFIYSDDQRQDAVGFNGNQTIITPELDKFAATGIQFNNANVVFSLCSPSRAAMLTGRYGSANGVLQLGSDLNPGEKTVAQYLKQNGYLTGMSGKWHIGRTPEKAGFDFSVYFEGNGTYYGRTINDQGKIFNPGEHCDLYCANRSVDFIREASQKDQPFFLFHNTQTPHMNNHLIWDARVETTKNYNVTEMPVAENRLDDLSDKPEYLKTVRNRTQARKYGYPESNSIQQHTLEYYSVITEMDQYLGLLFQVLDELDLMRNTYVFFMSDNGWMLGDHGFTSKVLPYRPSTRVPFFVVGPGLKPKTIESLVLNIDMAPTILELAGIEPDKKIHGKCIIPLFMGKTEGWRESFVYEGLGTFGGAKPNLAVVSKNYRYIETYEDTKLNKVVFQELYDQKNDPSEMNNLFVKHSNDKEVKEFQHMIKKHKETIVN